DDPTRPRWLPGQEPFDLEFVATDVPAFGCRRYRVAPAERVPDQVDDGRVIEGTGVRVAVADDGTLTIRLGDREYSGLLAVEDRGDRGDTYDFDPVDDDPGATLAALSWQRQRHPSGTARLRVERVFTVPHALAENRDQRTAETVSLAVRVEARVAAGVPRVDLLVRVDNTAADHRLRLLF